MSYTEFSVSLLSVHGIVQIHVLFEKLTATVVLINFKRCHLKTIDNCYVITIHIQYTISLGLILTWTRINVFHYIACCIIHLVILFNTLNCIQGDHAIMHMKELPMFTYNLWMKCLHPDKSCQLFCPIIKIAMSSNLKKNK